MLRDVQDLPEIQAMLSEAVECILPFPHFSMEHPLPCLAQAQRLLGFDLLQATRVARACCDA